VIVFILWWRDIIGLRVQKGISEILEIQWVSLDIRG